MFSRQINKLKELHVTRPAWALVGTFLLVITAIAMILRFYQVGKLSFWCDEISTMLFAGGSTQRMFEVIWPREMNMNFYYLLVNFWAHLFSNPSEGILRIISVVFSIASVPTVFLLGRTISSDKKVSNTIGLAAAFIVSLNAFHIQYAQELRSYSLIFLLATLSTLLLIKTFEKPGLLWPWIWYVVISVISVYSHYFMIFLIIAQVLSMVVLFVGKIKNFPFKKIIAGYVVMMLLIIPLIVVFYRTGTSMLHWVSKPTFDTIWQFCISITGGQGAPLLVLYIVAVSLGIVLTGRTWKQMEITKKWVLVLFASCLFLPVCMVLLISEVRTPIFVSRYFIFIMPFLSIFAAAGIVKLIYTRNLVLKLVGAALFILIVIFSSFGIRDYFMKFQKEDWRGVSAFLAVHCLGPEDLRLYYPTWSQNFTSYYDNQLGVNDSGAEGSLDSSDPDKVATLIPKSYKKVCLVRRWAEIKTVQVALQKKYPNVTTTNFYALNVDIYTK